MSDWSEAEKERVKNYLLRNGGIDTRTITDCGWWGYIESMENGGEVEWNEDISTYHWCGDTVDDVFDEDDCSPECECRADAQYVDGEGNPLGAPDGFEDEYFPDESHDTFVLEDAIETVYSRPEQHGEPEDSFATIASLWNDYLYAVFDGERGTIESSDVAMMMALLKIARSAEGAYDDDNPRDICGYMENYARLKGDDE